MWTVLRKQPTIVLAVWGLLAVEFSVSLFRERWSLAFVSLATFGLTLLPILFARRFGVRLPTSFLAGIVLFIFATIFLGEAFDFYNRYWWWDIALHSGSALGFGLMGFLMIFMMFGGDRYAAPPWAVAFFSFCFAVSIGAMWEIFEFAMDQLFGLNMQKSGLIDTMWDLIVDCLGAFVGAFSGFLYLKLGKAGLLTGALDAFVSENRELYRKSK